MKPKIHNLKGPLSYLLLNQPTTLLSVTAYFFEIHFSIILPPTIQCPSGIMTKTSHTFLSCHRHAKCPTYLILLGLINLILQDLSHTYTSWLSISDHQAVYKSTKKQRFRAVINYHSSQSGMIINHSFFLIHSLMMVCWKPKCVHVARIYIAKLQVVFNDYNSWFCSL